MEHHSKGMKRKWERHYREAPSVFAVALVLVGFCILISLALIWPQKYFRDVFDSRMAYRLILDVDDYLTCDKDYHNFVIDEPEDDVAMHSFYLFNVSNAFDVIQRGSKPIVTQVGPYGFQKFTYKYDVSFDPTDSTTVSFKEYTMLREIDDTSACKKMFYRLDNDLTDTNDPCHGNTMCECAVPEGTVTIINPAFLKLLWQDSQADFIAQLSLEPMTIIKDLMENEFVTAVKAHLVYQAYQEIFLFRRSMQIAPILTVVLDSLLTNYSISTITDWVDVYANQTTQPETCGLKSYGITTCPLMRIPSAINIIKGRYESTGPSIKPTQEDFPSLGILVDSSNNISFFNMEYGLPLWISLTTYYGYVDFNYGAGYTTITTKEMETAVSYIKQQLLNDSFAANVTVTKDLAAGLVVQGLAYYFAEYWLAPYTSSKLTDMVYDEFFLTHEAVPCDPWGHLCVWQWGYNRKFYHNEMNFTTKFMASLINVEEEISTNPNSLVYAGNTAAFYNTYKYCSTVYFAQMTDSTKCLDINNTIDDATLNVPAGLWGVDHGYDNTGRGMMNKKYLMLNSSTSTYLQDDFFLLACNISYLQYEVYPAATDFHDNFVVRYLNLYSDPQLSHTFTVGNWKELGWAQWGGGFVTEALLGVRALYQVVRDGMWYFGEVSYYSEFVEYGSWAIVAGFPNLRLFDVNESKTLLYALTRDDDIGLDLRRQIVNVATTFIGDGSNYQGGVGAVGEVAFTAEFSAGNFSCEGPNEDACKILNFKNATTAYYCNQVEGFYDDCVYQLYYLGSSWVTHCTSFETAISSSSSVIQCNDGYVFGQEYPYSKSRGNVFFSMFNSFVIDLVLKRGYWCNDDAAPCRFEDSGMFLTTTIKNALFNGYYDKSIVKYLNMKHKNQNISFECIQEPYKACNLKNYDCGEQGLRMVLPHGQTFDLIPGVTERDKFFQEFFEVAEDGEMLWRYEENKNLSARAVEVMQTTSTAVYSVRNPYWAAYPGWNTNDTAWNMLLQCQRRMYGGSPGLFSECYDTLNTGLKYFSQTLDIEKLHGNSTVRHIPNVQTTPVTGATQNEQFKPFAWSGFTSYPYLFSGRRGSPNYESMKAPVLFNKENAFRMELSQKTMAFADHYVATIVPFRVTFERSDSNFSKTLDLKVRRFVEDETTWDNVNLGKAKDAYGMNYTIPKAMISLEMLAGFPLFAGTPNGYLNEQLGGAEYLQVTGTVRNQYKHRTYADYDPVTGRALRRVIRQQINTRPDMGPLYLNAFAGQSGCKAPTNYYDQGAGYGCWAYIPMLWYEDARLVNNDEFYRLHDHYYARPNRAFTMMLVGIAFGLFFVLVGVGIFLREVYYRRKFNRRVYIE